MEAARAGMRSQSSARPARGKGRGEGFKARWRAAALGLELEEDGADPCGLLRVFLGALFVRHHAGVVAETGPAEGLR